MYRMEDNVPWTDSLLTPIEAAFTAPGSLKSIVLAWLLGFMVAVGAGMTHGIDGYCSTECVTLYLILLITTNTCLYSRHEPETSTVRLLWSRSADAMTHAVHLVCDARGSPVNQIHCNMLYGRYGLAS
jgi:hypothetical protein